MATLLLRYGLNDNIADGQNVIDSTGNFTGTVNTYTSWLHDTGKVGTGCFYFTTLGKYITCPFNPHQILGDLEDFSIGFWIKGCTIEGSPVIVPSAVSATTRFHVQLGTVESGGMASLSIGLGDQYQTTDYIYDSTDWQCIVIVWDSTNEEVKIYVNNSLADTLDFTGISGTYRDATTIIGRTGSTYFTDYLDEFRIWSGMLTADEMTAFYNSGNGTENLIVPRNPNEIDSYMKVLLHGEENTDNAMLNDVTVEPANLSYTATSKFGSYAFDFSQSDSADIQGVGTDNYGNTSPYVFEFWIYFPTLTSRLYWIVGFGAVTIYYNHTTGDWVWWGNTIGNKSLSAGQWYHVYATCGGRFGAVYPDWYIFIDGEKLSGSTVNSGATLGYVWTLGKYSSITANAFNGYIDEFSFRRFDGLSTPAQLDTLRHTTNFIPPTKPYTHELAHYKMNDTDATTVIEDSAGVVDGLIVSGTGATFTTTGKINTGLRLLAGGDILTYNDLIPIIKDDTVGSITFWVYPTANTCSFFGIGDSGDGAYNQSYIIIRGQNSYFYAHHYEGGSRNWSASSPLTETWLNNWHHVALVQDGVSPKLYLNGVEGTVYATTDTTAWIADISDIDIVCSNGYSNAGTPTEISTSHMDDLRIYRKALTEDQVKSIYNGGDGTEDGLDLLSGISIPVLTHFRRMIQCNS